MTISFKLILNSLKTWKLDLYLSIFSRKPFNKQFLEQKDGSYILNNEHFIGKGYSLNIIKQFKYLII